MKWPDFEKQTGWSNAKASRKAAAGIIRPEREGAGTGNYYEYSDRDVTMARIYDELSTHLNSVMLNTLAVQVADIVYNRTFKKGDKIVVEHPRATVVTPEQLKKLKTSAVVTIIDPT